MFGCEVQGDSFMDIKKCAKDYLIEIEIRKYTPKTYKTYRLKIAMFNNYCIDELGIDDMEDVTLGTVKQFTQALTKKGRKGTYINSCLKVIKSFIQYCYEEDFGGFNTKRTPFRWVKEDKPVIKAFNKRQVKHMLDSCRGSDFLSLRDDAIIKMFLETGIRCMELYTLAPADIRDDYILIHGKGNKERYVPISPVLKKALHRYDRARESYFAYRNTEPYYFLSNRGRMLTNSGIEHMIRRRGEGIEGVRVSAHTFRHTFAQQTLKNGLDLYSLSRLLGHESVAITQVYLHSMEDSDIVRIAKGNSVLLNM